MGDAEIVEDTTVVVSYERRKKCDNFSIVLPRGYAVCETWRVVDTDNFGGDYPDERVVASGFASEQQASVYADTVNTKRGEHSQRFLKVVKHFEIAYILSPGFEP